MLGCLFINLNACVEHFFIKVIDAPFNEASSFHPFKQFACIGSFQDNNVNQIDVGLQELCLRHCARDAVEEQELLVGEVPVCCDQTFNVVVPDSYGHIIGH